MKKHSGNCAICGIWREVLDNDHIVPKHLGGTNEPSNLQRICQNCHREKTSREEAVRVRKGLTPEEREKQRAGLRAAYVRKPRVNPMLGRKHSEETKALIRAKKLGVRLTPEHRQTLKDNWRKNAGRKLTDATKAKLAAIQIASWKNGTRKAHGGTPHSEETKAKISASRKAYAKKTPAEKLAIAEAALALLKARLARRMTND